ncbi:MAG: hypothetical protein R3C53_19200 [Pirellulaceae bacterium]
MTPDLVQVTAPGLPTRPKLWFDPVRKQAMIRMRLTNWRNVEWGAKFDAILRLLLTIMTLGGTWLYGQVHWHPGKTLLACLFGGLVFHLLAGRLCSGVIIRCFSEGLFPSRVSVWLTEEAMAVKSCLYSKPIVLWRTWKGFPVPLEIAQDVDDEATELRVAFEAARKPRSLEHLKSAVVAQVIYGAQLSRFDSEQGVGSMFRRALPLFPLDRKELVPVILVLKAAIALTAKQAREAGAVHRMGRDIDGS